MLSIVQNGLCMVFFDKIKLKKSLNYNRLCDCTLVVISFGKVNNMKSVKLIVNAQY